MMEECHQLEREAHQFLMEHKTEQAYETYRAAGACYRKSGKHAQSAVCFTQAASCWNKHIGQHPLRKAAESFEDAAGAFLKSGDYRQACARFSDAALLYEREGDAEKYSICFYQSKCAGARMEWKCFVSGKGGETEAGGAARLAAFFRLLGNMHSRVLWGYGEKPFRTLFAGLSLILFCAVIYANFGQVLAHGLLRDINFFEALYFSVVTYTTVGYGDYMPGDVLTHLFAGFEAVSGIILTPIFVVGLTRRYLRMSR